MLHCLGNGTSPDLHHSELLTQAQLAVIQLVAAGLANKEIALRLGIGEATVKSHVGQATKRLGFSNRVQLAVWYVRMEHAQALRP